MIEREFNFGDRVDPQEPFEQTRQMRHQLMQDRAFRDELLRAVYEAGPRGIRMSKLMDLGIERGWWQDTVGKHFGEKMRAAWSFGLIVVTEFPGSTDSSVHHVVHPLYASVTFEDPMVNNWWIRIATALQTFNYTRKK